MLGGPMVAYQLYFLDESDQAVASEIVERLDDGEACSIKANYRNAFAAELWQDNRLIARFEH